MMFSIDREVTLKNINKIENKDYIWKISK